MHHILEHNDFLYTRVQGLSWSLSGVGMLNNLTIEAGQKLNTIYKAGSGGKTLVIDFRRISNIPDRNISNLFESIQINRTPIVFHNVNGVYEKISKYSTEFNLEYRLFNNSSSISIFEVDESIDDSLEVRISDLLKNKIINYVKDSFRLFKDGEKILSSTPILASGEYNAGLIISDPERFFWTSLLLADTIENIIGNVTFKISYPYKFLAVSLRGTPLATSVGLLLDVAIETIDHLGPKYKVFEKDTFPIVTEDIEPEFIYIGDFTIGGTEIKTAQTYANMYGCKLNHAVVLGSLFESKYFTSSFHLHPLVPLNKLRADATFKLPL